MLYSHLIIPRPSQSGFIIPDVQWFNTDMLLPKPSIAENIIVDGLSNYLFITSLSITIRLLAGNNNFLKIITDPYLNFADKLIGGGPFVFQSAMASSVILFCMSATNALGYEKGVKISRNRKKLIQVSKITKYIY